jgi:hypothetical protein
MFWFGSFAYLFQSLACNMNNAWPCRVNPYIFFAIGEYSPFFIKRSELQVSYERIFIAHITNY